MPRVAKAPAPAAAGATNFPVLTAKSVVDAVKRFVAAKADYERAKAEMDVVKPVIKEAMADSPTAYCGTHVLNLVSVAPLPPTANRVITKEMVGQVIPGFKGKAGYDMLQVR